MKVLVTGSSGLIGSEAVEHFDREGHEVFGVDNNMRRVFFGAAGDTLWNLERLKNTAKRFTHAAIDIRDRAAIEELFGAQRFDQIVHCAAQPSHDKAGEIPLLDFEVNALGTVNLLEMTREHCPEAVFVFLSTNKVYGDAPNEIPTKELETRYDYARAEDYDGIDETCRIDRALHSLFGASKAAADLVAQDRLAVRGGGAQGRSHLLHFKFAEVPDALPELEDYARAGCYSGGNGRNAARAAAPFRGEMRPNSLAALASTTNQGACLPRQRRS